MKDRDYNSGMELSFEPSVVISIVAVVVAILSMFYTRKRAKIMEQELEIIKVEKEKERVLEEASGVVRDVKSEIEESIQDTKCKLKTHGYFLTIRDDIIRFIFDGEQHDDLDLHFDPIRFDLGSVGTARKTSYSMTDPYSMFEDGLRSILKHDSRPIAWVYYQCQPKIKGSTEDYGIDLSDLFDQLIKIHQSMVKLAPYKEQISVFDSGVSNEMQRNLFMTFRSIYENAMKSHRMKITKGEKSEEIKTGFLEEMMGLQSLQSQLDLLTEGTKKLSHVQEELFRVSK
jgi:hypothetical protein